MKLVWYGTDDEVAPDTLTWNTGQPDWADVNNCLYLGECGMQTGTIKKVWELRPCKLQHLVMCQVEKENTESSRLD